MLRQYKLKDYKFRLVLWVLILSVIGIMVIGSANSNYQMKQMIGMGVGIVFMIMVIFDGIICGSAIFTGSTILAVWCF